LRVAVVSAAVPNPDSGGGALTVWSVVDHLLRAGHEVGVLPVHDPVYDDAAGRSLDERLAQVRALGAEVHPVVSRARAVPRRRILAQALRPRDEELAPHLLDAPAIRTAVEELAPDVLYAYGWDAIASTRDLRGRVPRLGVVVDLAHLPELYRFRRDPKRFDRATAGRALLLQALLRRLPRLEVELLNELEAAVDHAAHHAEWLRRKGVRGCRYLRAPMWDRAGPEWRKERDRGAEHDKPRVLLIGHLRGTSTQDGLDLFAKRILPLLERELGPDGFEARVAGGFDPPDDLRKPLSRPSVRLLGHLPDAAEEFRSADCILVPTTIRLGARVRIVTAFSFGCPVVTHDSSVFGIPELADGENALVGRSAEQLAAGVVRVFREPELKRRLEDAGRATYERYFAQPVAGKAIEELLASIVRPGSPTAAGRAPIPDRP
jgi:glycosyltransferase involved in cell wall biosynthesis